MNKRDEYLKKLRQVSLIEAGIDVDSVEKYEKYITADNEGDMQLQVAELSEDIGTKPTYADVSVDGNKGKVWRPF